MIDEDALAVVQRAREHTADTDAPDEVGVVDRADLHRDRTVDVDVRRRDVLDDRVEQRNHVHVVVIGLVAGVAVDRAGVDDGEVELRVVGAEIEHELEHLVDDLVRAGARTVDLVDDDHRLQAMLERVLEHETGLRHRALEGVDDEQAAVGHLQDALDLAAEVGVARRVDDVDLGVVVANRDVLREDGDSALPLLVVGVENTLRDLLVLSEYVGGLQEPVDQRGLAVVDVGDDGDVTNVVLPHDAPMLLSGRVPSGTH